LNKIVEWKLNLIEEKATKQIFEQIKSKWYEVIDWNHSGFIVNLNKLVPVLKSIDKSSTHLLLGNKDDESYTEEFIPKSSVNMRLLQDAIIGFAFERYNLDANAVDVDIQVCEKIPKGFIKRFVKKDLRIISQNDKNKIDYGISCKIKNSTLNVSGVPDEEFKEKTIVIQIYSRRQRILKELWIHEMSRKMVSEQKIRNKESIARGNTYEIF